MGYKLAGCNVLGGVEIDPQMMSIYRANLHPRISHLSDIRTAPVPNELIDILDGSPPCSSFSMIGAREKGWGKEKRFREGQAEQRLDDLFFAFLEYAEKVRPRVIVAENVVGLLNGNARAYARRILETYRRMGYAPSIFQLSAAHFGVPQARERVFFVGQRGTPKQIKIKTTTALQLVTVREALADIDPLGRRLNPQHITRWTATPAGRNSYHAKKLRSGTISGGRLGTHRLHADTVAPTLTANSIFQHWSEPYELNARAYARLQSFPDDYNFGTTNAAYVCGMSVPPFLMRGLASQLVQQLFGGDAA